ncbi:hypothetical protein [Lactococcus garvieae]|uniref:hypothetical protein n=1 Tax=Lactococcus garvieae TaxID=1363 RepID=UPI000C20FB10|nr:hypothetical protein [Lactococcus garvieae]
MNLASMILLSLILIAAFFSIRKTIRSKGACEDCTTTTCPVKGVSALEASTKKDCCD